MKTMKITEIQITLVEPKGLATFASIVVKTALIWILWVFTRGLMALVIEYYPTKKIDNKNMNIYHSINKEKSKAIEGAIISEAEKILTN